METLPSDFSASTGTTDIPSDFKEVPASNPNQGAVDSYFNNPVGKIADFISPAIHANTGILANQMDYMKNQPNATGNFPQALSNAASATGHLASQLPEAGLNDALSIFGAGALKGGANIAKQVATHPIQSAQAVGSTLSAIPKFGQSAIALAKQLPNNLSYNQIGKAINTAATNAPKISWDTQVADKAIANAKDLPKSVQEALGKLLSKQEPPMDLVQQPNGNFTSQPPSISGTQALELRKTLGASQAKDIFGRLKLPSSNDTQQATDVLRRTVSDTLKQVAPDIKTPDAWYSFYKRIHGDVPTWGKRIVGGYIADQILGNKAKGLPEGVIDALGALLAGEL